MLLICMLQPSPFHHTVLKFVLACSVIQSAYGVIYVDRDQKETEADGVAWPTAFPMLEQGIKAAVENGINEIWIKAGTYHPIGFSRDATFELIDGIRIYGGFNGTEQQLSQRDPILNRTVLSGDTGRTGSPADNSFHVITGASNIRLDGLVITRGNANAAAEDRFGGGLYLPAGSTNVHIAHCTFEKNYAEFGGAIQGEDCELFITNSTFFSNSGKSGGAISTIGSSSITLMDTTFSSNFAPGNGGAVHLVNPAAAHISNCFFLYNSTYGKGGALAVECNRKTPIELEVLDTVFNENSGVGTGGGLYLQGSIHSTIEGCRFERNASEKGSGAWANALGVLAIVTNSTFILNSGADGSGVIQNDEFSCTAPSKEKLILAAQKIDQHAAAALFATPEPEPEPEPDIYLGNHTVYDANHRLTSFQSLLETNSFLVIIPGDLTDPEFIQYYRMAEAAAQNYKDKNVLFYYLYRYLKHPENNAYVQPVNLAERKRHVQLAKELLQTRVPWLYDQMDQQGIAGLSSNAAHQIFMYDDTGLEVYAGTLQEFDVFEDKLTELTGGADQLLSPDDLPAPSIEPVKPLEKTQWVKRVVVDANKEHLKPIKLSPQPSKHPYYAKARVEASQALLETGDGSLYLGFHLDPLYDIQWNNLDDPLSYQLKTSAGVVAPSINSAPRLKTPATDTEPREFLLEARKLDTGKPMALTVTYSVYSAKTKRPLEIQQHYLLTLQEDPFAGAVIGRQRILKARQTPSQVSTSAIQAFQSLLRRFDLDRNGKLTNDEVIGGLRSNFNLIDSNNDGSIDSTEYSEYRSR